MPRNITVTLADGQQHVYANAPDDVTPEAVSARAQKEFGQAVTALDGGRGSPPAQISAPAAAPAVTPGPSNVSQDADGNYVVDVTDQIKPANEAERIKASAVARSDQAAGTNGNFLTALKAGVVRGAFGVPERLMAAGAAYLPSAITGNETDASYDQILAQIRANTDADLSQSIGGNLSGQILSGGAAGNAAAKGLGIVGGKLAASGVEGLSTAGNYLQKLMTLKKGPGNALANAGKMVTTGAAAGATQAAGEGSDPIMGAAYGAGGTAVLGGAFKGAQVLTRPFRDFLRVSSAGQILGRLTTATKDQLSAKAAAYREATGAEPTLFELLPLTDRNKILKQAVVGRDNVVESTSSAIRERSRNLGPEMSRRTREILAPRRNQIEGEMHRDMSDARGGVADPLDARPIPGAARSPTDMSRFRDDEARAIMAPHENTPVVADLTDLYPHVPGQAADGTPIRVSTDPEVTAVLRSAAGVLKSRADGAGVNAGEITNMISTLRGDLGKGGIEGRTAERAIEHLQNTLDEAAPEAGAAARQMNDAYAARSRMMEGMQEGAQTRMRDDVQVGTSRREARRVGNAYDTPEGADGRTLGQGNRIIGSLEGSADDALRSTVGMSRNSTGRQMAQNLGNEEANAIVRAAQAQDESAQALASASQTATSGGGEAASAETLVAALAGLHPASFLTTKAGAVRKLIDMTYIPNNRAKTMVDMIFSQDPAMVRRALDAVGNEKNGASFMKYLSGLTGMIAGGEGAAASAAENGGETPAAPVDNTPSVEDDLAGMEDLPADAPEDGGPMEDPSDLPVDEASSPYAANLQTIYDTESPELLDLINRQSGQESGGRQHGDDGKPLTSSAGAIGVMQVMPDTGPEAAALAGVPWDPQAYRHDAAYNKLIGIAYMSQKLRDYDGDVAKALAAYNAGAHRLDTAIDKYGDNWLNGMPAETIDYVQKIA